MALSEGLSLKIGLRASIAMDIPIPGTKHTRYLEENVGALRVALTPEQHARLAAAFPAGVTVGARYHEQGMRAINL